MIELITAINTLYSTYKTVKELYEKASYNELKSHILAMNEQMLDMKEIAIELRDENVNLKEEIKKLKDFENRGLHLKKGAMYDKDNNGPYCPNCYENKKILNLMGPPLPHFKPTCPQCNYNMP